MMLYSSSPFFTTGEGVPGLKVAGSNSGSSSSLGAGEMTEIDLRPRVRFLPGSSRGLASLAALSAAFLLITDLATSGATGVPFGVPSPTLFGPRPFPLEVKRGSGQPHSVKHQRTSVPN